MESPDSRARWTDRDLLAAIADRDGEACAVFYRRHLPRTVAFLMRETRDPDLAADLTAEVFAAVIVAAARYRPQGDSAGPWVIGIARNTLGTSRRRHRVEERARRRLAMEPIEIDELDGTETEAIARSEHDVAEAVAQLTPEERYAVEARVMRERSYRELAAELECSEMVVRKRVSRGLEHLRRRLEQR